MIGNKWAGSYMMSLPLILLSFQLQCLMIEM